MTVLGLFKKLSFEQLWDAYILKIFEDEVENVSEEYSDLMYAFDEIKSSEEKSSTNDEIKNVIIECLLDDTNKKEYMVSGLKESDSTLYCINGLEWDSWTNLNILDKYIEIYGDDVVAACILWEMTYLGYDWTKDTSKIDKQIIRLEQIRLKISEDTQ